MPESSPGQKKGYLGQHRRHAIEHAHQALRRVIFCMMEQAREVKRAPHSKAPTFGFLPIKDDLLCQQQQDVRIDRRPWNGSTHIMRHVNTRYQDNQEPKESNQTSKLKNCNITLPSFLISARRSKHSIAFWNSPTS